MTNTILTLVTNAMWFGVACTNDVVVTHDDVRGYALYGIAISEPVKTEIVTNVQPPLCEYESLPDNAWNPWGGEYHISPNGSLMNTVKQGKCIKKTIVSIVVKRDTFKFKWPDGDADTKVREKELFRTSRVSKLKTSETWEDGPEEKVEPPVSLTWTNGATITATSLLWSAPSTTVDMVQSITNLIYEAVQEAMKEKRK